MGYVEVERIKRKSVFVERMDRGIGVGGGGMESVGEGEEVYGGV